MYETGDIRKHNFLPITKTCLFKYIENVTRVLQKVLSVGSDYFSATFYQTYFYYKP